MAEKCGENIFADFLAELMAVRHPAIPFYLKQKTKSANRRFRKIIFACKVLYTFKTWLLSA